MPLIEKSCPYVLLIASLIASLIEAGEIAIVPHGCYCPLLGNAA
jgi:hypothetical protein